MSDQETAIQLIRNEAAELIVRARTAGLSVLIFNGPDGVIIDIRPLKPKVHTPVFATVGGLPDGSTLRCEGYAALGLDVEPRASGKGVHVFVVREPK